MLAVLMLFYSPHFAITVTDPVNIMAKGFRDSSYNLEVLIPEDLKEDDIFQLARLYNEEFLPLKARNNTRESGANLALKLEDFDDLLKGEPRLRSVALSVVLGGLFRRDPGNPSYQPSPLNPLSQTDCVRSKGRDSSLSNGFESLGDIPLI